MAISLAAQATSTEILAPEVLRFVVCGPALDFRFLSPGQTEVGSPFPVDVPHKGGGGRLGQNSASQSCKKRYSVLSRGASPLPLMTGSGHFTSGSGHLDGDISTRSLTVCRLRPGTGLPVPVSRSDGSGQPISGRRSAQGGGGRLGQNSASQSCKKRYSVLSRGASPLPLMTGSGHFTSGSGHLTLEILAPEVLRFVVCGPALDFRFLSPGQTEVGSPFPVDVPHKGGGRLGQNSASQSCKKRYSVLSRGASPLLVMTGSGHFISGSGHLDGDISTRSLTVCRSRPGTGLPVPVSRSDGSGQPISGRRSAQGGGRLGQNSASQSCKKRYSVLSRGPIPLPVMTGSGHFISGSGHLTLEILAPEVLRFVVCGPALDFRFLSPGQTEVGSPFPVDVPHKGGGRLGQNSASQSCKKRYSSAIERGFTGTREFDLST